MNKQIINPFLLPKRGWQPNRPLCPWEVADHEAFFVDVDGTGEAFKAFYQFVDQIDISLAGHASIGFPLAKGVCNNVIYI